MFAGSATYAVAGVNAAGTGAAATVTVIWQAQATLTDPGTGTACVAPSPLTLPCSSGPGALTFEPIYACTGNTIQLAGWRLTRSTCAVVPVSAARFVAWEFHHPQHDDYFITADPAEREALDRGADWVETGVTYRVWALGDYGTSDMCRFYGDSTIDAVTGQRIGPDSHFYTAAPDECATVLVRWPQWILEGRVFGVTMPAPGGGCPTGTRAVTRYFKPFGTPSHRYVPGTAFQASMIAAGWQSEGTVWCMGE